MQGAVFGFMVGIGEQEQRVKGVRSAVESAVGVFSAVPRLRSRC